MDKAAILIELKKAKIDYLLPKEEQNKMFWHAIFEQRLEHGFCYYFENQTYIIEELEKDLLFEKEKGLYWYPTVAMLSIESNYKITKEALQPRLQHLQRTINRLENELKNQPTI